MILTTFLAKGAAVFRRVPSEVWVILVALVALYLFGFYRYREGVSDERERNAVEAAEAAGKFRAEVAGLEAKQRTELERVRADLGKQYAHGIEERDRAIARLSSGELRLRERFTCPNAARLPATAGAAARGNGAEARGLSRADADFFIRFAAEADAVAMQLAACQETVRGYRANAPG